MSVAIIDFGLGNLFSVQQACAAVDLRAQITASPDEVRAADAVILPGVGAFGDAMTVLEQSDLEAAITDVATEGKLVVGICLGMQLLCMRSEEFGVHRGLGLVNATVRRLPDGMTGAQKTRAKVPEVGWNAVREARPGAWQGTPLDGFANGAQFYFVHSFIVVPDDDALATSKTTYGDVTFCSSLAKGNIHGFQFHPERSGRMGLKLYENIAAKIRR